MIRPSLITAEQLKQITIIQVNVDSAALEPYLSIAEDLHIRNLLGEDLYINFRQAFDDGTMSSMYATLLAFIQPTIAYYAFYEYIPFSFIKVTNKGLEKKIGNNAESVGVADVNYLRTVVLGYAKAYAKELTDWLTANNDSFLPYSSCSTIEGESGYRSGKNSVGPVYFPKY